jgi:hypothetical protein
MPASSSIFIAREWSLVWSIASSESACTIKYHRANVQRTNIDSVDSQLPEKAYILP